MNSPTPTYKGSGFLLDANSAAVTIVREIDSGTHVMNDGGAWASQSSFPILNRYKQEDLIMNPQLGRELLDELASIVPNNKLENTMNEIKADVPVCSIKGLFVSGTISGSDPSTTLQTIAVRDHLSSKHGLNLPIYIYNRRNADNQLIQTDFSQKDICELISKTPAVMRSIYTKYFEETGLLGGNSLRDKGKRIRPHNVGIRQIAIYSGPQ